MSTRPLSQYMLEAQQGSGMPSGPQGSLVDYMHAGGRPTGEEEKSPVRSFGEDVASGMGFDVGKINRLGGDSTIMQALEMARQAMTGMGNWMTSTIKDPAHIADPLHSIASSITNAAGLPDTGSVLDPSGYHAPNLGKLTGALANVGAGVEAPEMAKAPGAALDAASSTVGLTKKVGKEIMGIGPTTERLKANTIEHANAVQDHVTQLEQAVENEAKTAVQGPIKQIDAANPKGYFKKSDIAEGVKDEIGNILKTDESLPKSIQNLLGDDKPTSTARALTTREAQDAIIAQDVIKKGGTTADARSMLSNLGYTPRQMDAVMSSLTGTAEESSAWTAEQMRQLRSAVGRDLGRFENKGAAGAALNSVYRYLTGQLREGARSVGAEADFLNGDAQYKAWKDDFHRSPLKKIINGQTSSDILKGLSDERSMPILDKYTDRGVDTGALREEVNRGKVVNTVQRFSAPSKWDLIVGALRPEIAAIRLGVPYVARHNWFTDMLAGKGLDPGALPKIKAKQVSIRNNP